MDVCDNLKIVLCGGYIKFVNKFKKIFPNIKVMDTESYNANIIRNADLVLLQTNSMSHELFSKVTSQCRSHNIKFDYLKCSNLQICKEQIIDIVNSITGVNKKKEEVKSESKMELEKFYPIKDTHIFVAEEYVNEEYNNLINDLKQVLPTVKFVNTKHLFLDNIQMPEVLWAFPPVSKQEKKKKTLNRFLKYCTSKKVECRIFKSNNLENCIQEMKDYENELKKKINPLPNPLSNPLPFNLPLSEPNAVLTVPIDKIPVPKEIIEAVDKFINEKEEKHNMTTAETKVNSKNEIMSEEEMIILSDSNVNINDKESVELINKIKNKYSKIDIERGKDISLEEAIPLAYIYYDLNREKYKILREVNKIKEVNSKEETSSLFSSYNVMNKHLVQPIIDLLKVFMNKGVISKWIISTYGIGSPLGVLILSIFRNYDLEMNSTSKLIQDLINLNSLHELFYEDTPDIYINNIKFKDIYEKLGKSFSTVSVKDKNSIYGNYYNARREFHIKCNNEGKYKADAAALIRLKKNLLKAEISELETGKLPIKYISSIAKFETIKLFLIHLIENMYRIEFGKGSNIDYDNLVASYIGIPNYNMISDEINRKRNAGKYKFTESSEVKKEEKVVNKTTDIRDILIIWLEDQRNELNDKLSQNVPDIIKETFNKTKTIVDFLYEEISTDKMSVSSAEMNFPDIFKAFYKDVEESK